MIAHEIKYKPANESDQFPTMNFLKIQKETDFNYCSNGITHFCAHQFFSLF